MKFLHIIKDTGSQDALAFIKGEGSRPRGEIGVVLIQNARNLTLDFAGQVFVLKQSTPPKAEGGGQAPSAEHTMLDYGEFLDLIFESEKVVVW